jgi:antitoxin YefM
MMPSMTASQARREFFPLLKKVNEDHDVVRIVSKGGNGVLMSEEDYEAWKTTVYLFSNPANAAVLRESFAQAKAGKLRVVDPSELVE